MKFSIKFSTETEPEIGDILLMKDGRVRMIVVDNHDVYSLDLSDGELCLKFDSVEELVSYYEDYNEIDRIIKSDKVKLVEIGGNDNE